MIAVMTMNVGFFFAVILGFFFGEFAFGRVAKPVL
jgi:copper transporter 1